MHPADWAAEHVHVENSERGAKFDPSQTRWWRKPMGCYADYETTNIVCIMPTGAGKSTFFEAINCWIIAESPGSVLYASQTDTDAELWKETRFMKAAQKCRPLDHLWPSNTRNAVRKDAIVWPHMFMVFGGANISNFQEKSITFGQGDEAWIWRPGMVGQWLARSHNRENRKFTLASQAGVVASEDSTGQTCELHLEHDKCRKWDFAWRCPGCGVPHSYVFEQLKWDEVRRADESIDDQLSADTVRRVCPTCAAEYPDTAQIRRMLHDSYQENDGYLCVSDTGRRGYEGFHVDRGALWWCPWADDVMKKLAADRLFALGDHTGLMDWTMKDRAIGWSENNSVKKIELAASGYTEGDYSDEARKIDGEKVRFATIDAGGDHFWMVIRAWAAGGASRLLWFGYVATEEECEAKRVKYAVEPLHTFLDVGFDQERMAGIICRFGWQGLKGDGNRKLGWEWEIKNGPKKGKAETRLYSKRWHALSKEKQRAVCWHIATTPLQYILQRLIDGKGAAWEKYDDTPPTYLKHLNGERLVIKSGTKGQEVREWTRFGANHGRDGELYQVAAALMFKIFAPADIQPETEETTS